MNKRTHSPFMQRALRLPLAIIQFGTYVLLIASACLEIIAVIAMMYVTLVLSEPDYTNGDVKKLALSVLIVTPEILMFVAFYRGYQKRKTGWGKVLLALGAAMVGVSVTTLLTVSEVVSLDKQGVNILNSVRFILVLLFNVAIHIPYLLQMALDIETQHDELENATETQQGATVTPIPATVTPIPATVTPIPATVDMTLSTATQQGATVNIPVTPIPATVDSVVTTATQQGATVDTNLSTATQQGATVAQQCNYTVYALSTEEGGIFQVGYATRNSLRTLVSRARNSLHTPVTVSVVCETDDRSVAEEQKRNLQQFYDIS